MGGGRDCRATERQGTTHCCPHFALESLQSLLPAPLPPLRFSCGPFLGLSSTHTALSRKLMVSWQRQALWPRPWLQTRLEAWPGGGRCRAGPVLPPCGPSPLQKAWGLGSATAPETCQLSALKTGERATKPSFKGSPQPPPKPNLGLAHPFTYPPPNRHTPTASAKAPKGQSKR